MQHKQKERIAIIGSGITGLSCAWHLAKTHPVTLFEKDDRLGGHSNTVDALVDEPVKGRKIPVDTGFIVFNPKNYPNLVALFKQLNVPTHKTDMSFAVSLNDGQLEYSGSGLSGLFAQKKNLFKPRFIGMVCDVIRFYKETMSPDFSLDDSVTLGEFIQSRGYGDAFRDEHLLPMGAAIWSTPMHTMLEYPANVFLKFCANHGLLQIKDRPQWHSVQGGSREYVKRICDDMDTEIKTHSAIKSVRRLGGKIIITDRKGDQHKFDHLVLACHADQSLNLLQDASEDEKSVLKHFKFERNRAVLHTDTDLLPKNPKTWSSWNYMGETCAATASNAMASKSTDDTMSLSVSYWMNKLQKLATDTPLIVTLNPFKEPKEGSVQASFLYDHPIFDKHSIAAQKQLWDIQGQNNTWFCGAWCGYGFHEDGIQSGLLVAEAISGQPRPWNITDMNARIPIPENWNR